MENTDEEKTEKELETKANTEKERVPDNKVKKEIKIDQFLFYLLFIIIFNMPESSLVFFLLLVFFF